MNDGWRHTEDFAERLRWARSTTRFERAVDAARSLGIKPGTYRSYERPRSEAGREPPLEETQRIAAKFKVSWSWLATGRGSPDDAFLAKDPRIVRLSDALDKIESDRREDAINAAAAVINSFIKHAS